MLATTEKRHSAYRQLRNDSHPDCVVCCPSNGHGLGMEFYIAHDGAVEASFACDRMFQGYPDILHGGVVSMLLDGAMTNCLFSHNIVAMTADLAVRFRHPVATTTTALVRAWITSSLSPLYELTAKLVQNDEVKATATGKFLEKSFTGLFCKTGK
jgi:acyl-coenzyme A thioesterase PaaI-like protein